MNILNHSEFDSVTMKKFAKMSATPTKGWKIFRIFTISIIVLMALLVTVCVLIIPSLWVHGLIVYLCCLVYFGMNMFKRKQIANCYKSRGITAIRYTFLVDEFRGEIVSEKMKGCDTVSYSSVSKVIETKDFLCIRCKNGIYLVKKDGFSSNNDLVDVRIKFSSLLGKNYIFHK